MGRLQLDSSQHREDAFPVMVVHLNFRDVGAQPRDGVHDGIGQPTVVRTDGCNDNLHWSREQGAGAGSNETSLYWIGVLDGLPCQFNQVELQATPHSSAKRHAYSIRATKPTRTGISELPYLRRQPRVWKRGRATIFPGTG